MNHIFLKHYNCTIDTDNQNMLGNFHWYYTVLCFTTGHKTEAI